MGNGTATSAAVSDILVQRRLAGEVRTSRAQTLSYIERTLTGDTRHTFGLSDWSTAGTAELVAATEAAAGDRLTSGDQTVGYISPERVVEGMLRHAAALAEPLRTGGRSILLATGHPMGLLEHYGELAAVLRRAGNTILRPLDDQPLEVATPEHPAGASGIRFVNGTACAFVDEAILHTHRPDYMVAMLGVLESSGRRPDLVIADHGMAGAAIEAGIPTLSIADVNDVALLLAHARGRHDAVLCIEDNLAPAQFRPVTEFILTAAT